MMAADHGSRIERPHFAPYAARQYFAQIAARTKRTEYREVSRYWKSRLEGREYDKILFRNGYARNAPEMLVEFRGVHRYGKGRSARYAIRLGRILKVKRWIA